jgi:hypothetical protein
MTPPCRGTVYNVLKLMHHHVVTMVNVSSCCFTKRMSEVDPSIHLAVMVLTDQADPEVPVGSSTLAWRNRGLFLAAQNAGCLLPIAPLYLKTRHPCLRPRHSFGLGVDKFTGVIEQRKAYRSTGTLIAVVAGHPMLCSCRSTPLHHKMSSI